MNDLPDPQDWWHEAEPDPLAGLGLPRMALWLLILIPLHEAWCAIRNWRKK